MDSPQTWVLLRGLARQSKHWGPFLDQFQQAYPEDLILTPDLPGMGLAKNVSIPKTIHGMMEHVRSQVFSKVTGPVNVFSVSLGGMVAMSWLDAFPGEISSSFILNSSSSMSPFFHRLRWESWPQFLQALGARDPRESERRVLEIISNHGENREMILPLWEQIRKSEKIRAKVPLLQVKAASQFKVPKRSEAFEKAHFIVSLGDRLVEPDCTMKLAEHFGRPVEKHGWGGHDLPIDDPQWLIQHIQSTKVS